MFCNQCEKETDGKNGFCLYCGEKLGKARPRIPENDLFENEKPAKKNRQPLIIVSVVTFVMILFFSIGMASNGIKGYFRDSKSVMSTEQVKDIEKSELIFEDPSLLYYEIDNLTGFEGETTGVTYSFNDQNKLTYGYYSLYFSESDQKWSTLMDNLAKEYEKIYGTDYAVEPKSFSWFTDKSYI